MLLLNWAIWGKKNLGSPKIKKPVDNWANLGSGLHLQEFIQAILMSGWWHIKLNLLIEFWNSIFMKFYFEAYQNKFLFFKNFFWKKGHQKKFTTAPYSIPFLSIWHQNKALHNFHKMGQHPISWHMKGLN